MLCLNADELEKCWEQEEKDQLVSLSADTTWLFFAQLLPLLFWLEN